MQCPGCFRTLDSEGCCSHRDCEYRPPDEEPLDRAQGLARLTEARARLGPKPATKGTAA